MRRRDFIVKTGVAAASAGMVGVGVLGCNSSAKESDTTILHTVIFDLKHAEGSQEEKKFFDDAHRILTSIPGVRNFRIYRQCSPKNNFKYGFHMAFDNTADFKTYSDHPDHNAFVKERWDTEVTAFQEADFVNYNG